MGWIDPLREVQAQILAIEAGLKTREQIIRQNGDDPRALRDAPVTSAPLMTLVGSDDEETEDQPDSGTA